MDKSIKQMIATIVISILLIGLIPGLVISAAYYHSGWVIGKTYEQIEERYGSFDYTRNRTLGDRTTPISSAGYIIVDKYNDRYWGDTVYEQYWMIEFDEDGIAYECHIEQGGWFG